MNRRYVTPRIFWPLTVAGGAVMAFGIYGLFDDARLTRPSQWVRWFFGSLIAHDLILAPIVIGLGVVITRRVRGRLRAPLQGALIATGIIALTMYPFVRGYGTKSDNPSALPNHYTLGLLAVVGVVWIGAAVWAWRRRPPPSKRPTAGDP